MDVSSIQTYIINSARVVFLNERPHPRSGKPGGGNENKTTKSGKDDKASRGSAIQMHSECSYCHRILQSDANRYCSISCKVNGKEDMIVRGDVDMSFAEETIKPVPRKSTQAKSKGDSKGSADRRSSPKRDKSPVSESSKQRQPAASPSSVKTEEEPLTPESGGSASSVEDTTPKANVTGSLKRKNSVKDLKSADSPVTPLLIVAPSFHRRKGRPKKSPVG